MPWPFASSFLLPSVFVLLLFLPPDCLSAEPPTAPAPPGPRGAAQQQPAAKRKRAGADARAVKMPKPSMQNVKYGPHERHVLDLWKAESAQPTPMVFVIHGGGWQGGTKERVGRFVDVAKVLDAGISVCAINYRLISHAIADDVKPPVKAPLRDAARALQFVRHQAADWNIDPARVGAAGGSAGACSSLWLAFHDDLAQPNSTDPVSRQSTRLQCAAVIGAQTTLDPQQMKLWTPNSRYGAHAFGIQANRDAKTTAFEEFLKRRDDILPWIAEYSPFALVTKGDPPIYIRYSTPPALGKPQKDPTHTANFGVKLQERCEALNVPCEIAYPRAPGSPHESPTAYLIKHLKQ